MLRTFMAALALCATVAAAGSAFAQNAQMNTASQSAAVTASSSLDGLHTDGSGGRAYQGGQKTN
jgi:hypothetical protein